jgi:hypothetical protein
LAPVASICKWLPAFAALATAISRPGEGVVAAGWRDHDRAIVAGAEDFGRHFDLADIDQPARPQLEFLEALAIGAQRHLVVGAGDDDAEMPRRQILLRDRLEVEDVERLLWIGDDVVQVARRPHHRIGRPRRQALRESGQGPRSHERTGGEKLQHATPAGGAKLVPRHDQSPFSLSEVSAARGKYLAGYTAG